METNITEEQRELVAYKLIRREVRRFDRHNSDAELANYVRGIVDMQTEMFSMYIESCKAESEDKG